MPSSRRQFLTRACLGLTAAAAACRNTERTPNGLSTTRTAPSQTPPGAPPAFGTAPAYGPEVSPATFAEAEKLVNVQMTAREREQAAANWRRSLAPLYERRTGPRKLDLASDE